MPLAVHSFSTSPISQHQTSRHAHTGGFVHWDYIHRKQAFPLQARLALHALEVCVNTTLIRKLPSPGKIPTRHTRGDPELQLLLELCVNTTLVRKTSLSRQESHQTHKGTLHYNYSWVSQSKCLCVNSTMNTLSPDRALSRHTSQRNRIWDIVV